MDYEHFNDLLAKTKSAYDLSDIKKHCDKEGHQWFYSLCATKIIVNKPLIIGFNWGAGSGVSFAPQMDYPTESFYDLHKKKWLGSLSRIIPYCEKYISKEFACEAGQSNYCFFRSYQEDQISEHDLELCKPIFRELLEISKPSLLLCFSARLRDHLILSELVENCATAELPYRQGNAERKCLVAKGEISFGKSKIYFLPHPNWPLKREIREEAWEFCFIHG